MKKLFLSLILISGIVLAQAPQASTTFTQVFRNNGSGAAGSTWTNNQTHYTEMINMRDVDSAWVVVNFPDSVNVAITCENYTADPTLPGTDAVKYIVLNSPAGTGVADSITHTGDNTGYSISFSLTTWYQQGYPLIRLKSFFVNNNKNHLATGSDATTLKYKYYIKRFRHK